MEPFLADMDASPRDLAGYDVQRLEYPRVPARFNERGDIKEGTSLATRGSRFSCAKSGTRGAIYIVNGR